jgi:hypothetical protein
MNKITKKTIKRINDGYHDDLMEAIEFLIDSYKEDKFDAGYACALDDMEVRGYRLAEYIVKQAEERGKLGKDSSGEPMAYFNDTDDLAQVIEEYFNDALNG